jgi:hypothetical protein
LAVNSRWLPAGILQRIHLAMQYRTALLNSAVMTATDDPALEYQDRTNRDTPFIQSHLRLIHRGLHK